MKKVVLISGGTDGIGRVTAQALRDRHTVIILSNDGPKCLRVAGELDVSCVVGDAADFGAMQRAVDTVVERHGRLDVVINNAGLWIEGDLETNHPDAIKQALDVNTLGTLNLTRAAVPVLKQQGSGRIINVISQAGLHAKPGKSVYDATKWAVTGFTQALQEELTPHGVAVTGIYPGKVHTKLFEKAGVKKPMDDALSPDEVAAAIALVVDAHPNVLFTEIGLKWIKG
jgi:NAD(P)-dependent dehydrogenase (short-subunit alcohol dehydrogenase family)